MINVDLFFQVFNLNGRYFILDQLMIFASTSLIYLTFLLSLLLAFKGSIKERKALLLIIITLPIAVLLIKFIHLFIFEPRPWVAFDLIPLTDFDADASFPSRHATISAVLGFSYLFFKSKWAPLFLFIAAWIGFSRIFVGVHYPLDVLGGFATALLALVLAVQVKKIFYRLFLTV